MVLDVTMPDLDGVAVVRRMRADGLDVPVCMLSARDELSDRVAGLQAGRTTTSSSRSPSPSSPAPGTGLGLAIVAQQVAPHDGELRLEDSDLGGLRVAVRVPAAAATTTRT